MVILLFSHSQNLTCQRSHPVILSVQGLAKEAPKLFNPAEEYDDKSVLLVTLAQKTITLTAKEVTAMPWPQFVRLMKVSNNGGLCLRRSAELSPTCKLYLLQLPCC